MREPKDLNLVGWNWVLNIAKKGHEVTVITRRNNKLSIDNYLKIKITKN